MKKIRVSVQEINYGSVVIEVEDGEEVYDKAYEAYCNGEVFWNKGDLDVLDWEEE